MEEPARYISIAAYFKVNGIKVAEPSKEKPTYRYINPEHLVPITLTEQMNYWSERYRMTWDEINRIVERESNGRT